MTTRKSVVFVSAKLDITEARATVVVNIRVIYCDGRNSFKLIIPLKHLGQFSFFLPAGWTGRRHWPIGMVVVSGKVVVTGVASVVVMTKIFHTPII